MAKPKAPPPVFTVKPSQKKTGNDFTRYVNSHKAIKPWAALIAKWAPKYGLDPIYLAALILFESGGNPNARSSANAVGLAQIHLPSHPDVTEAQARNPAFAIKWAARFFGAQVEKYGSYREAYFKGYNPGYKGPGPFAGIPKSYVAKPGNLSPTESAQLSVEKGMAKEQITQEGFLRQWDAYNNIYQAYAGRNAKKSEANWLYRHGVSEFTLAKDLAKKPAFFKSPIWKAKANDYIGLAKDMGVKINKKFIATAIVNNYSGTSFQEYLRSSPGYLESNEFKSTEAGLTNAYKSLYGDPDEEWQSEIKRAALGRWTPEQWQSYLRADENYRNSSEYQGNLQSLQGMLGFLPTLTEEPQLPGGQGPPPPRDRRVR